MGYHFSSRLTATLNLSLIYLELLVVAVCLSFAMVASLPPLHSKHLKNAAPLNIFDDFEAFMVPLSFASALFFYNVQGTGSLFFVST